MKRFSIIVWGILIFFLCIHAQLSFGQQVISVVASGSGTTKPEALQDAMRRAVEKAVGAYVLAETTLQDDQRSKAIIVNSDATVTNYEIIHSEMTDGIWTVKIKAKVLPNEYLKYCPRTTSQSVSALETGDVANRRKTLQNASQTFRAIFRDYSLSLYRLRRIDRFKLADEDDFTSNVATVTLDFDILMDQKAYQKLQGKLCSLLDSISLKRTSCKFKRQLNSGLHADAFSQVRKKMLAASGIDEDRAAFVCFAEVHASTIDCKLYLLPQKMYDILSDALTFRQENIICSVALKDKENTDKYVFTPGRLRFYEEIEDNFIVFYNMFMLRDGSNLSVRCQDFCFRTRGTMQMRMPAEYFDQDKISDLKIYALFLKEDDCARDINEVASEAEAKIFVNSPDRSNAGTGDPSTAASRSSEKADPSSGRGSSGETDWICPNCNGSGVITTNVEIRRRCSNCGGKGSITRYGFGQFDSHNFSSTASRISESCGNCSGEGFVIIRRRKQIPCPECSK